ncbi:MAG: hypothetical protein HY443_01270 [Candidatus Nealsonbacteria bacterium]|nr:hypothetical protein [Candidatus Nealsonbacteria bacterium]
MLEIVKTVFGVFFLAEAFLCFCLLFMMSSSGGKTEREMDADRRPIFQKDLDPPPSLPNRPAFYVILLLLVVFSALGTFLLDWW